MLPYLSYFHALDLRLLYLINVSWSSPWLDPIMARVADFNTWRWPLYITEVLVFIFWGFRWRLFIITMCLCLIIGDGGVDWSFKLLVNRPRPMEVEPHLRVVTVAGVTESKPVPPQSVKYGRSFTSGHACNNMALAIVASAIFGRSAWFLFPWALLVSYARVYGANHYPSDIVGSWIVAICYTYAILKGVDYLWRRYAPVSLPGAGEKLLLFLERRGWIKTGMRLEFGTLLRQLYKNHPVLFPSLFP